MDADELQQTINQFKRTIQLGIKMAKAYEPNPVELDEFKGMFYQAMLELLMEKLERMLANESTRNKG